MKLVKPEEWQGWGLYVSVSSTAVAFVGVYFGALVPLVEALTFKKALIWSILCLLGSFFLYLRLRHISGLENDLVLKKAVKNLSLFGVLWAMFPFFACSFVTVTENSSKDCICREISPEVALEFRKHGDLLEIKNHEAIGQIIEKIEERQPLEIRYRHPDEMERLMRTLESRKHSSDVAKLLAHIREQEQSITIGLFRLIATFTNSPLPASAESDSFRQRIRFQMGEESDLVVLGGEDALQAVYADLEGGEDHLIEVKRVLSEAVRNYLVVSIMDLYRFIRGVRNEDAADIDPDFVKFLLDIPHIDENILRVAYPGSRDDLIGAECGSIKGIGGKLVSSKFWVQKDDLVRPKLAERMSKGYWKLEPPSEYFDEVWWLEHAIWQMLSRLPLKTKDILPLKLDDYYICGAP